MSYHVILSRETEHKLGSLCQRLRAGHTALGARTASNQKAPEALDWLQLLELLLRSKRPCIFAESEVKGDGSDWTQEELQVLGDISIAADVTVFDDGEHHRPEVHHPPFDATLIFTPGALLRNDIGGMPADFAELVIEGSVDPQRFRRLYERRLLPVFKFINATAAGRHRNALVTVPGIGCGQFAGRFQGTLGALLSDALEQILAEHAFALDHMKLVRFDPFNECEDRCVQFRDLTFRVRPLSISQHGRPQLCRPMEYEEPGDDLSDSDLFSVVAWDHVSWPGNDFYRGSRATDDGVKAAATNAMESITGIKGKYNREKNCYQPPEGYRDWEEVVDRNGLALQPKHVFVQ